MSNRYTNPILSMTTKYTNQDLKALLENLTPESLAELPEDVILELRKEMNPYGRTIEGSNGILLFSYTDLRASYLKKLLMTGMIGFLNRACDEWMVPDDCPVIPVYDYVKNPHLLHDSNVLSEEEIAKLDEEGLKNYKLKEPTRQERAKELQQQHELMKKRIIVKEFLEYLFQFDPDKHVRSAHVPNICDQEREILNTPAANLAMVHKAKKDKLFKEDLETIKELRKISGKTLQSRNEKPVAATIKQARMLKNSKNTPLSVKDPAIVENTTEMIPPADIFHRFTHYLDTNYEELRDVVKNLYCEKPDLETAINPYVFYTDESAKALKFKDAADAADKFMDKHKNEVIAAIYQADSGKWNLFGPFKQNMDRVKFYNEKTRVLEAIMTQLEDDSKLGAQLMQKRIIKKKKENISKYGPDDPAFLRWKAQNSALKNMGAETLKTEDLEDEPNMDELEIPVYRLSQGGQKLEKSKIFIEAEKPTIVGQNDAGQSVGEKKQ